ncbi:MAG: outer membrane lipid asymmetry maintenance protein MlaD [Paracoccaceae bacterium]
MSEKNLEIITGTIVLIVAAGFLVFIIKIGGFSADNENYNLNTSFRSAEGIDTGTEVRMAGVKIGTVKSLSLNAETLQADVKLKIEKSILIPNDSSAVISSEGLLGGSFLEIVPGGSFDNYAAGEIIEDTQSSISLINLLLKMFGASKE